MMPTCCGWVICFGLDAQPVDHMYLPLFCYVIYLMNNTQKSKLIITFCPHKEEKVSGLTYT